jgi:hypothetical protein
MKTKFVRVNSKRLLSTFAAAEAARREYNAIDGKFRDIENEIKLVVS